MRAEVLAVGNGRMVLHWMHCLKANRPLERKGKGGKEGGGKQEILLVIMLRQKEVRNERRFVEAEVRWQR